MCIPMIMKLVPIIWMTFYLWAIVGIEIFNTNTFQFRPNSPYEDITNNYTDFTSFGNACLVLFQVTIEAEWSNFTYDYAYKFQDFLTACLYFNGFHLIVQVILLSLIKGIVWEVFTVVEKNSKKNQELEEMKTKQEEEENRKRNLTKKKRTGNYGGLSINK